MLAAELQILIRKIALENDQYAFKQVYFHYYQPLFKLGNSFVISPETAEEVVDDVFVRLWENRSNLMEIKNLKVYLYVAVKNASLNHLTGKLRIIYSDIDNLQIEIKDFTPSAEDNLITAELLNLIYIAIDQMTPQCRLVFKLVKEDGLKYKEVAEILAISTKTVEYHIGNALKIISSYISPIKTKSNLPSTKNFSAN